MQRLKDSKTLHKVLDKGADIITGFIGNTTAGIAVAKITQLLEPATNVDDSVGTPGTTTASQVFANAAAKVASNYVATSLGVAHSLNGSSLRGVSHGGDGGVGSCCGCAVGEKEGGLGLEEAGDTVEVEEGAENMELGPIRDVSGEGNRVI